MIESLISAAGFCWMILPVWYLCFDDNVDLIQLGITQGEVSAPAAVMLYDPR